MQIITIESLFTRVTERKGEELCHNIYDESGILFSNGGKAIATLERDLVIRLLNQAAPPATPFHGLDTMTVGATNLALGDFGLDARLGHTIRKKPPNIVIFHTTYMIKFKNTNVRITTVDTGVFRKERV